VPFRTAGLNDRQQHNIGVLQLGWRLLCQFIESTLSDAERIAWDPPQLDLSMVMEETTEAAAQNPTWDAVQWALDQELDCVWEDENFIYIQHQQLLVEINRSGTSFKLPGSNATTLKKILIDEHGGEAKRCRKPHGGGNPVHCVVVPVSVVQ
jgi:hypothetical protein